MAIVHDIVESLKEDASAEEVRVGAFWTAVVSRGCGLASTVVGEVQHHLLYVRAPTLSPQK